MPPVKSNGTTTGKPPDNLLDGQTLLGRGELVIKEYLLSPEDDER
jgi:hypothetical protein